MKSTLFYVLAVLTITSCQNKGGDKGAVDTADVPKAAIEFLSETQYNFGVPATRDTIVHYFVYKNVSDVPFVINKVERFCGCTVVSYSDKPLAPGQTDSIRVSLGIGTLVSGYLYKACTIHANSDSLYRVVMTGTVPDIPIVNSK